MTRLQAALQAIQRPAPKKKTGIRVLQSKEDEVISYAFEKLQSREWRWIQGAEGAPRTGVCLIGALKYASYDLAVSDRVRTNVLSRVTKELPGPTDIPSYNDTPHRNLSEVLGVLEKALKAGEPQ